MAAGALIVQEAGGLVTQVDGKPYSHLQRSVLASNGYLHQAMLDVLKR
jgi:myo-inositol-1(or 4)-monophosphatase